MIKAKGMERRECSTHGKEMRNAHTTIREGKRLRIR